MNPGGSSKDRIALAMVQDAKKAGIVNDNTKFVEATSGNTGIGLAMNAAILGNECTILTGEKNSSEKVDTMRLLGAEVFAVKGDEIDAAQKMKRENPDTVVVLNQFENLMNPMSHFENTGGEILDALDQVDMVVIGAGTGGTLSGVGLRIKQKFPDCIVVAAEPDGSIMLNKQGKEHPFLVEGVGGTWVPMVLDTSLIDHVEVVNDQESFLMARELVRHEGLLCGGSSGTAMCAAIKAAKALNIGEGKRVVVILPDGTRNYMTKFVSDQWMEAHLFMDPPQHTMKWWNKPITDLKLAHKYPLLKKNVTCEVALNAMKHTNIAVIIDDDGHFVGAVSKDNFRNIATNPSMLSKETSGEFNFKDLVSEHLVKDCYTLAENGKKGMPTIGLLSRMLDITPFVVIGTEEHDTKDYFDPKGVVTGNDVLDYIRHLNDSKSPCNCRGWAT
ncbi:cystathionine beta-synthase-like [Anticarsia gemmatalis]|uniref:cystathionine beta-synthase-like n=1 Tax=Anticarsia gemmatalis TaxID=129554 RepID=UPI003F766C55